MSRSPSCDCRCDEEAIPCDPHGPACSGTAVMYRCGRQSSTPWVTFGLEELVDVIACAIIPAVDDETDEEWCVIDRLGRLWITEQHGATHLPQEMWEIAVDVGSDLQDVAFATDSDGIAVGDNGVILITDDGGRTWSAAASGTGEDLRDISFQGRIAYVCGNSGTILKSTNAGATWSALTTGISGSLISITHRGAKVWACGASDLIRSADGGASWSTISGITNEMTCVTFHSESAGVIVFTTCPSTLGGGSRRRLKVWRSTNRGGSWTLAYDYEAAYSGGSPPEDIEISGAVASSDGIDAVGGYRSGTATNFRNRIWIWSSNTGEAWTLGNVQATSLRPTTHWDIDVSPRGGLLVAADHNGGIDVEGRLNPTCVLTSPSATGTSPMAYGVQRADTPLSLIYNGHDVGLWGDGSFSTLYASPTIPACIWRSSINIPQTIVTDINFDLDFSGADVTLTLSWYGDTITYTKPKVDWVWGRNLMHFASASAGGQPNMLRLWICQGSVVLCPLCQFVYPGLTEPTVNGEWRTYDITIPTIPPSAGFSGVTGGVVTGAAWKRTSGGAFDPPTFHCEYEGELNGSTVTLKLGLASSHGSPYSVRYAGIVYQDVVWFIVSDPYYSNPPFPDHCGGSHVSYVFGNTSNPPGPNDASYAANIP